MYRKNIFYKKHHYKLFFILILFISLFSFFLFLFLYHKNNNFFQIIDYEKSYYIIPEDKGGKIISNQNKKGLHLSDLSINKNIFNNDPNLEYSIQIITNENYDFVINKKNELIIKKHPIIMNYDLYLAILNNNLGIEYLLLYKNFDTRDSALNYCNKYVFFVKKCIVVNVKNL